MISAKTLSIPEAGKLYYGLGRAASFKAAERGDLIVVGSGKRYRRVSVPAMERKLLEAGEKAELTGDAMRALLKRGLEAEALGKPNAETTAA